MGSERQPLALELVSAEPMLPGVEPVDWTETLTRVQRGGTYWLATASRDGKPHLVPC